MQNQNSPGNQNNQKQSALSWSQPPQSSGAKPISQVSTPPTPPKSTPPTPPKSNLSTINKNPNGGGGRFAWIFISGIVVGLIIGWGWFSLRGGDDGRVANNTNNTETPSTSTNASTNNSGNAGTNTGTPTTPSGNTSSGSGSLVVGQQTAGNRVTLSNISVSAPTWISIHDNNNGMPGNALGAAMFFPGGATTGTIELLRATVAGRTYLVAQYVDNGDHQFSKQADTAVKNIAGNQLLIEFTPR